MLRLAIQRRFHSQRAFLQGLGTTSIFVFAAMALAVVIAAPAASASSDGCYYGAIWGWGPYGWQEEISVVCADPDEYEWPAWEDPEPEPGEQGGGGDPGYPEPHGKDGNGDGYAACAWTVVDQNHPRGHSHVACQVYGATGCGRSAPHAGVDFSAAHGDTVRSVIYGRVIQVDNSTKNGNYVRVQHPDGSVATSIHLNSYSVSVDDWVAPGSVIGTANCTGSCSPKPWNPPGPGGSDGSHVYLQIKDSAGNLIDPYSKLGSC